MAETKDAVQDFISARNEIHESARAVLLDRAVNPGIGVRPEGQLPLQGRDAVNGQIINDLRDPEHWVELSGSIDRPAKWERRFRWKVRGEDTEERVEQIHALLTPDGRIQTLDLSPVAVQPKLWKQMWDVLK